MKYFLILLIFLSGCSINVYSIAPTGNGCYDLLLRANKNCTSDNETLTLKCFGEIKERCKKRNIIFK